ncbi:TIGR04282 family arsenosugar biosynthesis glycosyltransferase [Neorhodopirellula pilleata]|uniref:Glycosyltransferase n=1 Tax=Neorhodopirellula pilleata TaxID=2714738 RepID=A0A5C5ZZP6_9BACT|nr:TIGR04282 family arsenosugar biosynthesis glycosyltransferase [Neorhodopirellula pilleata]TWT92501.1 hypothetical protein Pla100_45190 [Neorhodopirellula pilleata]
MFPANAERFETTIGIMAKYWEPGRVKTRLAQSLLVCPEALQECTDVHFLGLLGARRGLDVRTQLLTVSARLHERFVVQLLNELQDSGDTRELVGSPKEALVGMGAIAGPKWRVVDQGTGNLGDRMKRWFTTKMDKRGTGQRREAAAVLIGSDCPLLSHGDLEGTWDLLGDHDIVLGPAFDGGYYLIGIAGDRRPEELATVFDDVAWSTETVLNQTIDAIESLGWSLAMLTPKRDVDSAEDLAELLTSFPSRRSDSVDQFREDLIRILNFPST